MDTLELPWYIEKQWLAKAMQNLLSAVSSLLWKSSGMIVMIYMSGGSLLSFSYITRLLGHTGHGWMYAKLCMAW